MKQDTEVINVNGGTIKIGTGIGYQQIEHMDPKYIYPYDRSKTEMFLIEEELISMGFTKTSKSKYDILHKNYELNGFWDSPYIPGGRNNKIVIILREDRSAIRINCEYVGMPEDQECTLYEGYCKSVEFLISILQNLFGGDGQTQEDINKQFNGRLY